MDRDSKIFFSSNKKLSLKNRIGIPTGDEKGIGYYVAQKSLQKIGPQKNFQFLVWTSSRSPSLKVPRFKTKVFKTAQAALEAPFNENLLLEIKSKKAAGDWLIDAANLCLKKRLSALITGPVSKASIKKTRYKSLSQTPLLKKLSHAKNVFMVFRGRFFNVALLTDHRPLKQVRINSRDLLSLIRQTLALRKTLSPKEQKKPLGILGLNPHSGENGLIGKEEQKILIPLLKKNFKKGEVEGPLPPDTAFLKKNWKRYSFYLALYHDQGLIPFKAIHGQSGFALSLGLPFLRLSVDHGLGVGLSPKDICLDSFLDATKACLKLVKQFKK